MYKFFFQKNYTGLSRFQYGIYTCIMLTGMVITIPLMVDFITWNFVSFSWFFLRALIVLNVFFFTFGICLFDGPRR